MTELEHLAPNNFYWIDCGTTDLDAATRFYSAVFGWDISNEPVEPGGTYLMCRKNGSDVGGLYRMDPQRAAEGATPNWNSYVLVEDVDALADRVEGLGGRVLVGPFDLGETGRIVAVADPTGAVVCLWQATSAPTARRFNEPGTLAWNELHTSDARAAREFYEGLLGWTAREDSMGDYSYTTFRVGEGPVGGLMEIPGETNAAWVIYLGVADCDESASCIKDVGGEILFPPTDIPGVGRFASATDALGAHFSIIKMD